MSIPRIIAIVGPTAAGKTALAIEAAERLARASGTEAEIVSADSRQIYRDMDIGTAKPTPAERNAIPHHLIDIRDPGEEYTVADYKRDAIAAIGEILSRGRVPLLVGGTGLYVRAVVENLDIPSVTADPALRKEIEDEISHEGLEVVFNKLVALDPDAEYVVDSKNPRRVVRALEVARASGRPFTAQRGKGVPLFETLEIGLNPPAEILRGRIEARIHGMFRDNALPDEVRTLAEKYGAHAPGMSAIGYRELIPYLEGKASLDDAERAIILDTVHYAKRQLTWFRKDAHIEWCADPNRPFALIREFLEK